MAPPPHRLGPSPSPAEMQTLLAQTGLVLNPGQMADLVLAWRQVAGLIAGIPRDRPMADDQAFVFRLPPPLPIRRPVRARKTLAGKAAAGKKASLRKRVPPRR